MIQQLIVLADVLDETDARIEANVIDKLLQKLAKEEQNDFLENIPTKVERGVIPTPPQVEEKQVEVSYLGEKEREVHERFLVRNLVTLLETFPNPARWTHSQKTKIRQLAVKLMDLL